MFFQESQRVIQEMENKVMQLSKELNEANEEKAVSILFFLLHGQIKFLSPPHSYRLFLRNQPDFPKLKLFVKTLSSLYIESCK